MEGGWDAEMAVGPGGLSWGWSWTAGWDLCILLLLPGWGWKAGGRLLAPGVQESQACGPEPMLPETGSSLGQGGWVGPQFLYGTLEAWLASGGLAASPSVWQWGLARACPTYSPAQLPQDRLRVGEGGVHLHFQVFPGLGQPHTLTNQLLRAQALGVGVWQPVARSAPGCGCGRRPSWGGHHGARTEAAWPIASPPPRGGAGLAPALSEPG